MLKKNKKAFSIVEVVLVLAVAGLIFIMVFFVIPSIRRKQHNTQRKEDLGRFLTAVNNYMANNGGEFPIKNIRVGYGYNVHTLEVIDVQPLVENYIDKECKFWSGGSNNPNYLYDSRDNCTDDFREPGGQLYRIDPYGGHVNERDDCDGSGAGSTCLALDYKDNYAGDNDVLIYRGYSCGTTEGTLRKAETDRTFAMMLRLEGDSIACVDNE